MKVINKRERRISREEERTKKGKKKRKKTQATHNSKEEVKFAQSLREKRSLNSNHGEKF